MNAKQQKRIVRLLGALRSGQRAVVALAGDVQTALLRFEGDRTLSCERVLLQLMLARHWVRKCPAANIGKDAIEITEDGLTFWRRAQAGGDFADQQRILETERRSGGEVVTVNRNESPLARLARRSSASTKPWIDADQLAAGERLRADFERAQMRQKVTMSWDVNQTAGRSGPRSGDHAQIADSAIDARIRLDRALAAVGPELGGLLVDVCCFLKGLEQVEAERQWPRRSAKVVLRAALSVLDRHYRPPPSAGPARSRNWGAPGYRPALST